MRHIKLFEESSQEQNIYEVFKIDKHVVDSLIDICNSFDADFYVRVFLYPTKSPIPYSLVRPSWVEIYDSQKWSLSLTFDSGNFSYEPLLNRGDLVSKDYSIGYDIVTDWNSINMIYKRIKSEFNILVDEVFPVSIRNAKKSFRSVEFARRETYFIDAGIPIPVNSSTDMAWLPFSIQY